MKTLYVLVALVVGFLTACAEEDKMGRPEETDGPSRLLDYDRSQAGGAGRGQKVTPGQTITVLKNQGADDADVQLVTLYLKSTTTQPAPSPPGFFPTQARMVFTVLFGVGGASYQVLLTPKQGAALTLAASSVQVTAFFDEIPGTFPDEIVNASMAYGERPSGGGIDLATFDERDVVVPPAGTIIFNPPPFARAVTVMSDVGVATTSLRFIGGLGLVNFATVSGVAGQSFFEQVPVPDRTRDLEIVNNGAAPARYTVSWVLGI